VRPPYFYHQWGSNLVSKESKWIKKQTSITPASPTLNAFIPLSFQIFELTSHYSR
jgi:hypothetical protein